MAWPGLGKCTAYPSPGQDGPPLGVRWLSEGLGIALARWSGENYSDDFAAPEVQREVLR